MEMTVHKVNQDQWDHRYELCTVSKIISSIEYLYEPHMKDWPS